VRGERWHTELNRPHQESSATEGVVDDQWHTLLLTDLCNGLEVGDVVPGVTDTLDVDGLGLVVDGSREILSLVAVHDLGMEAEPREQHLELVVGPTVEVGGGDDVVTGVHQSSDGHELCALARGGGHSGDASLQRSYSLLKDIDRRLYKIALSELCHTVNLKCRSAYIHSTAVEESELLECEETSGTCTAIKGERRSRVDWDGSGLGGRVHFLTEESYRQPGLHDDVPP